ncbi:hypothetical protein ASD76_04655 [Altererythrobacter sp. Root672]|nr:hypothetical protein ASD76_04655 [Altererythrobacter sp. Root672]
MKDAWARDTAGTKATAAVYMTITAQAGDRLVGASTPIAGRTDLMTMHSDGGAMEMKYLEEIAIPADKPVSLDPSGLHVWLADLDEPLKAGQTFPMVLEFEKAGKHQVVVSIIEPAATPPMSGIPM